MNQNSIGILRVLLCLTLVTLAIVEPALANKFQTIGGGVSGGSASKVAVLKEIALYAGGFLIFLGLSSLLTRNRFEGLIGMRSSKKEVELITAVPIVLIVIGGLLLVVHFT